jgi:hypothetical protein
MTRCTCRHRIIDDPRRPFRLRIGVAYRVVEEDTRLVIRPASAQPSCDNGVIQKSQTTAA